MECFWILAKLVVVKLATKSANHHRDLVDLMEILGMEMAVLEHIYLEEIIPSKPINLSQTTDTTLTRDYAGLSMQKGKRMDCLELL